MDIAAWLHSLGCSNTSRRFATTISTPRCSEADGRRSQDLGVTSVGHRRRLLAAIAALGAALHPPDPPAPDGRSATEAERRQLTVMFCDLVGSTALSARLDPEDLREVIAAYHRAVAEVVGRVRRLRREVHGRRRADLFRLPASARGRCRARGPGRAGRGRAVGRLDVRSVKLQARVGIATGLVVVGDLIGEGSAQEQSVVGETPNLAARLQALAEPDAVVIAAGTRRLVGDSSSTAISAPSR